MPKSYTENQENMRRDLNNSRLRHLIHPLFTLFYYSHSPKEYDNLRKKEKQKILNGWLQFKEWVKYYRDNRQKVDHDLSVIQERNYPTPVYKNDIAGFLTIRIENPVEGYRIVGEAWGIENRRFKSRKRFDLKYGERILVSKDLLADPDKFNQLFFEKVEEIIGLINKNYLKKQKFYFAIEECQLNWDLMKTANMAMFLNKLGPSWVY